MASVLYNVGKTYLSQYGSTGTYKIALIEAVGSGGDDPATASLTTVAAILNGTKATELTDTNYAPGFGSASRKTLTGLSYTTNQANNRCEIGFDNPSWTALGGTKTVRAALLFGVPAGASADSQLVPIALYDTADLATNGSDFTLTVGANGAIQLT